MLYIILIVIWIVCGILTHGLIVGFIHGESGEISKNNFRESLATGFTGGFIALIVTIAVLLIHRNGTLKYGFKFWY